VSAQSLLVVLADESQVDPVVGYAAAAFPGADVTLFHVVEYTESSTNPGRGGRGRPDGWYADALDDAEALFDVATERLGGAPASVDTAVESGSPSAEILAAADDHDVDAVVLGFRKRNPTGKLVFGSTAQDVLLSTDRLVVAVPLADG
jgi:nucleotide-binding universal stress UspA family protein